ncbi:ankyrin repeat domain-containing protein 50-like [Mytilus trossulus]|uniref:ankyrin repeat domain-containing protein 50-like n=1 Tax=Mytilus trossulus TaxID=6551 RepID=UPI00300674AD
MLILQNGWTPLMLAARRGHLEVVTYLVTHGSQLEATDTMGRRTPLMLAAEWGHLEVVTYLVTQGGQLDATDTRAGRTPLMLAAVRGHLEVVTYLVTHGSQLDATSKWGRTPLMLAAVEGHLEVVTYLVTHGSQLDATDVGGITPLMLAAEGGHLEVVTYLVTQGSQLDATSKSLYENVTCKVRVNDRHTPWFNVDCGVKQGCLLSPTLFAAYINDLAKRINNLNCGVCFDDTVLSILLYADDIALIAPDEESLQKMLDTVTGAYGHTALHHAAQFGGIDVTKCLIDQGCSPWVKTKQGKTPYDLVEIKSYDDEEEKRKKEEVMDFLKTVMSKTSPEVTPDTHLQESAAPVVEGKALMLIIQILAEMIYNYLFLI